jgi:hypothetical protein
MMSREVVTRSEQNLIPGPIEGYKIFNGDMTCLEYKFSITEPNSLGGEEPLELCKHGFHFCIQPSGPWAYYRTGRVFKVKAYGVLPQEVTPGADYKAVCERIDISEEIHPYGDSNTGDSNTGDRNTGDSNTGYRNTGDRNTGDSNTGYSNTGYSNTGYSNTGYSNTGDRNTGDRNTGYRNTGDRNTGDSNTGYSNTGYSNTGDRNTGDRNTGDSNTGDSNTGDSNTGDRNTGDRNTGDSNTGYSNTGYWNCGDNHSGFFGLGEAPLYIFGIKCSVKIEDLPRQLMNLLGELLKKDAPINATPFLTIPNATAARIKKLHEAFIKAKKVQQLKGE